MANASDVVIWSADVRSTSELWHRLQEVDPDILPNVKIDRAGLTRMGLGIISELQDQGRRVFADAKIIEIPDKVIEVARLHLQHRPWMLNVMASVCSSGFMTHEDPQQVDALKRFADACHAVGTLPCAVTVLTSKTPVMVAEEFNGRPPQDQVLEYVEMLLAANFTDVVCSPREVAVIRSEPRFDRLSLNTPGIRMPGSSAHDQARVDSPANALLAGATRLVIGRDLTTGDLGENFARIATYIEEEVNA